MEQTPLPKPPTTTPADKPPASPGRGRLYGMLLSGVVILFIGVLIGRATAPVAVVGAGDDTVQILRGRDSDKTREVDFQLFWDAWDLVEKKYAKGPIDYQKMLEGAISGMLSGLDDPYTSFMPADVTQQFEDDLGGSFQGIGAEIGFLNGVLSVVAPLPNTPADKAGLKAGDAIVEINGESTESTSLFEAVSSIRGEKGTTVTLGIFREGFDDVHQIEITRDEIDIQSTDLSFIERNGKKLAVLRILTFDEDTAGDVAAAVQEIEQQGAEGIVVDLRNNPGGLLNAAVDVADVFLPDNKLVVTEAFRDGDSSEFYTKRKAQTELPVVVLTNVGSASASEIVAGALKDQRGSALVGEKTFGKGSVQELEVLKDGSSVRVTVAIWLTPAGTHLDGEGLTPDKAVERTDDDIANDRDPQQDAALDTLLESIQP